jgi:Raf kinase inhibitor-like YbhB/YbcL family protein
MHKFLYLAAILLLGLFSFNVYADDKPPVFSITTTAFLDQGVIPVLYTCDGKDINPEIDWANPPAKAKSFALILSDPDAPGGTFYHWIIYNIPPKPASLGEAMTTPPKGAVVGKNSFNQFKYNGPCPPRGATHNYFFRLYALDDTLNLPADSANGAAVLEKMKGHVLDKPVELKAVYIRWRQPQ